MDSSISWEIGLSMNLETKKKYADTGKVWEMEERKYSEISFKHPKSELS